MARRISRSGSRGDKRLILDEFVAVTGYHRKHAIRVLRHRASKTPGNKRHSLRYGGDVREALVVLWEASEQLCSKRLRPLIPVLLPALERHGRLELDAALRGKLLTMSPATMDRPLAEVRVVARGSQRRRAGMSSAVRRSVPVRTFGDWMITSRSISWRIPAHLRPAALCRRWCWPILPRGGPNAFRSARATAAM